MSKVSFANGTEENPKDGPLKKQGSWDIKKQRQGEADNPGPERQERNCDSDGEEMPTLVWEENNETETEVEENLEEESDDDIGSERKERAQAMWEEEVEENQKGQEDKQLQGVFCKSRARLEAITDRAGESHEDK